ncbi:hypothetical protein [Polyangium jinanense]|uniref:Uncharacterized protein n=1 Tax=Polyangium jinanense TaxID=2829994 RepID=A0A9X4AT40_9BACT|nr:hypothetical protein [Polyangium jinanense]MDC3955792.1 hypothetical protein [Polyangium jinanense]MDC3983151.1 hypothetical protein [Polyangium jinanense]
MPPAVPPRAHSSAEEHIRWSRGELRIKAVDDVVYEQVSGYLEKEIVSKITQPIDKLIGQGVKPIIFNDWWDLSGYDSDARLKLTDWIFWIRGKIVGSHILVRSKIVSMGVSIANLALGGMLTVYTDRQEFTLAYHRALRQGMKPSSTSSSSTMAAPVSTATPPVSQTSSGASSSATGSSPGSSHDEPVRPPRSIR